MTPKLNNYLNIIQKTYNPGMNRNVLHLIAAVCSFVVLIFWFVTGILAIHGFDLRKNTTSSFYVWVAFLVITQLATIVAGIFEWIFSKTQDKYAGLLVAFGSNLLFPWFVSLTFYMRSGLTKKNQELQIRQYVIDFMPQFEKALKEANKSLSDETKQQIKNVIKLQQKNLLSTFSGNAYKLELIEKEFPFSSWPKIWKDEELIAIANDTQI